MTIGERIAYVRKNALKGKKITLEEFGAQIGIKGPSVSLIENGRNNPSDQTIMMICNVYDVNENWLRTGEGEPFIELTTEERLWDWIGEIQTDKPDSFKRRFVQMLASLDPADWDVLERMMDKLLAEQKEKPEDE